MCVLGLLHVVQLVNIVNLRRLIHLIVDRFGNLVLAQNLLLL